MNLRESIEGREVEGRQGKEEKQRGNVVIIWIIIKCIL